MSFQTNKGNVQKHRNIKICCDFNELSAQPIDEICLFSVMTVYNARWKVLRAAVCKYRELAVKTEIRNSSYSVRKNPLVKRFRNSQSKFPNSFLFRENRQKVKCWPTPYSRRSKTFELYHFQSPREERQFKETSSSLAGM